MCLVLRVPLPPAGASLGPEGPSVDIGKSTAQALSSSLRSKQRHLTSLLAAGAGAGVAAGFNAPISGGEGGGPGGGCTLLRRGRCCRKLRAALPSHLTATSSRHHKRAATLAAGVFFAVETVLQRQKVPRIGSSSDPAAAQLQLQEAVRSLSPSALTIAMVLLAAVLAAVVSQAGLGSSPAFRVPEYRCGRQGGRRALGRGCDARCPPPPRNVRASLISPIVPTSERRLCCPTGPNLSQPGIAVRAASVPYLWRHLRRRLRQLQL